MMMEQKPLCGFLNVLKPPGMSSAAVVGMGRRLLDGEKVGHAGTLDPLATGVMVVCTGRATKRIDELQAEVKEYVATLQLGATTPCFDLEKPVAQPKPVVRAVAAPVKTIEAPKEAQEAVEAGVLAVRAPLPGTVNEIKVTVGQEVKMGETVVVLEAMKMENNIDAERGGKVLEVKVAKGDTVMEGAILVTIG